MSGGLLPGGSVPSAVVSIPASVVSLPGGGRPDTIVDSSVPARAVQSKRRKISRQIKFAAAAGRLTPEAARSIRAWLIEPRYAPYAAEVARQIEAGLWKELDDAFWTIIPFGTGGRRGKMYPIGSNTINDRTIGESAQGVADYVADFVAAKRASDGGLRCAIAYDTRHQSRHFAELCGEIMAAAGFKVFFLDGFRSTPELSFAVRHLHCDCGLMITASHNPPSDNAIKVYWSTGGQVLPPHDAAIIDRVMNVQDIRRLPFAEAFAAGRIVYCQAEADAAYIAAVRSQALPGPRTLKILYSPLHGVGGSSMLPVLSADGFTDVEVFGPQSDANGDFPNVPGHVANPENPAIFDAIIARGKGISADLIMATDPDADRLGCAAPRASGATASWRTLTGNQIGALLTDFLLDARRRAGTLSPEHYVVKTLVTTEMIRRIADYYGIRTLGNLQVGFKYIGEAIDDAGTDRFVIGCEESHGYLVGHHVRDKDAIVAAMLLAELAASLKAKRQTLHDRLESLYWQFGYHAEQQMSLTLPGSQGMRRIQTLMARFRTDPPRQVGEFKVVQARDYQTLTVRAPGGAAQPLDAPRGDMVMLDLEREGNYLAVRPSGTEPKVKFYLFAYEPAEQIGDLAETKADVSRRLNALQAELAALAKQD
jgi:phosphomannomutase